MKEPWEIYYDELMLELNRAMSVDSEGAKTISQDAVQAAGVTVHIAMLEHLVNGLKWRRSEADELLKHLKDEGFRRAPELGLREGLRHAWTDWTLRRSR